MGKHRGRGGKSKQPHSSPDTTEFYTPEKRVAMAQSPPPQPGQVLPPNMTYTQQMYQTPPQAPPPPTYFDHQRAASTPMSGSVQSSQQFMQAPPVTGSSIQCVLEKLEAIDKRLNKLDSIETQISCLSTKIAGVDRRVIALESTVSVHSKTISDIEVSRSFDAQICSDLQSNQTRIDKDLNDERARVALMTRDIDALRQVNTDLSEEVVNLQSRSMRDNLLFFGLPEEATGQARRDENCTKKIIEFCVDHLAIPDAGARFKIDRAHRIGNYAVNKKRPVVVKLNFHQDKLFIKKKAATLLNRDSDFRVGDQFPKVIQDRRKELYPRMAQARREGKEAFISFDTLYIDGQRFKAPSATLGGRPTTTST